MKTRKFLFPLITTLVIVASAVPFFFWSVVELIEAGTFNPGIVFGAIFFLPILGAELCAALALRYLLRPAAERRRAKTILCTILCSLGVLCVASLLLFFFFELDALMATAFILIPLMGGVGIAAVLCR